MTASRRVLVTGCGGSGTGRATAQDLARRGHSVVATARSLISMGDLDAQLKLELDVTDPTSIGRTLAAAGPIDALVNNAGRASSGPSELVPIESMELMFSTNFFGPARLMQGVLPAMRAAGRGTIINITSSAARAPVPLRGGYSASKAALDVLSEVIAFEVAPFGIDVYVVEPGTTRSGLHKSNRLFGADDPAYGPLIKSFGAGREERRSLETGPEVVARIIGDLIDEGSPELHHHAPEQANVGAMIDAHRTLSSTEYAEYMKRWFKIEW